MMKRNISDLLDEVREDKIRLEHSAPLSARQIKKRTMSQINKKKTVNFRWLTRVAAVAAIIAALGITACAADTVFNEGKLFGGFFGDTFSDSQMELINDIGKNFGESETSNGATITAISGIADENTYYIHLRVQAPEGIVLPDITDKYYYDFESKSLDHKIDVEFLWDNDSLKEDTWYPVYVESTTIVLPDDDPTDNVKEFLLRLSKKENSGSAFNSIRQKRIRIRALYIHEKYGKGTEILFSGFYTFDISNFNENRNEQTIVIDTGNVSFYNEEYDYTTTVKKVTISPLLILLDYSYTAPSDKYIFPMGGPVQMVMKDGSVIDARDAYYDAKTYPRPDDIAGVGHYSWLDEPIVVDDIDYLIFGGEKIVDVN